MKEEIDDNYENSRVNKTKKKRKTDSDINNDSYPCDQCDYQTTLPANLQKHIQSIHEGVKHPCNQCDYRATQAGHLRTHIRSKHEGIRYPCNQCDYEATRREYLRFHQKKKHENMTNKYGLLSNPLYKSF